MQEEEMHEQKMSQYWKSWVSNTSDGVIVLSRRFQVRQLNHAAADYLRLPREDAIGRSCTEILKCRNSKNMGLCGTPSCPLVRVFEQKKPLPNEDLIIGPTAESSNEFSVSVTPVDIGEDPDAIFTVRDISAIKVANKVPGNFVSMMSHELRSPLNSVHGFIDLLLQGYMGKLTEEQHKYLGYTQEGVQQLMSIVEDILFMTRSDVGQFEINQQEVNFRELARQVVSSLEPQARKANVTVNKDIPSPFPSLFVDPQRIKQVLINLVTNAIKFTPPGGTATIRARPNDDCFVMISVSDTGFGIRPEDREHVFERFYQSNHNLQSKIGGYGLGLSIVKLIVEQHGGTIGFDTRMNKGTTFYFTLPLYAR
ncbi:MAG: ATP-binding protein [Ktedonobacteraceae bacterium]